MWLWLRVSGRDDGSSQSGTVRQQRPVGIFLGPRQTIHHLGQHWAR